jgi:NitT/TauT family transport system permease protein/sulfonate transport system permease protein
VSVAAEGATTAKPRRTARAWTGWALAAGLFLLWQLSVDLGWVVSDNWPPLSTVLVKIGEGMASGEWRDVFMPSIARMLIGYAIGCAAGAALGTLLANFLWARRLLGTTLALLRPLPVPAIIPPLILLLGVDDALKLTVIAFGVFFPVFMSAYAGVLAVDPVHTQVVATFRVSGWAALIRVKLPTALPYIFSGMRTSLGLALIMTVIAEMTAGNSGIGYYIVSMQFAMRAADMYAAVILLSLLGYLLNRLFVVLEARWLRWARQMEQRKE